MYEIFKQLLESKNVTATEVCRATGISTSTITDWKKGRYTPKADKMIKIADYFGVSVDYLMGNDSNVQADGQPAGYYTNPETAALAQKLFEDPQYRVLFDAAEDSRPEDIQMAADLLKRLKEGSY